MTDWTADDVPGQTGRTVVITGANTGLGYEAATVFARRGATVVLACRDDAKAHAAADRIRALAPTATVDTVRLDLASQRSVHEAADRLRHDHQRIDLLINNAGGLRHQHVITEDGVESTFATNHLGAFALTGLLLDRLLATPGSRVVTVSSIGHRRGEIHFDDLNLDRGFKTTTAYFQSKLANVMFTYSLARLLDRTGTIAVAAHPGNVRTEFGRDLNPVAKALMHRRMSWLMGWLMQDPPMGVLGILRAAVDPAAGNGDYYGPPGRAQFTGHPVRVDSIARSHDVAAQGRLWAESERLTGVRYEPVVRGFSSSVHPPGAPSAR
ncbi:MAG TPA: oxidoreductase [Pseudonocardiaceae bacterium]|jgi:NAD(P)-dependent dehydrogenase (short-subunit alcohol dehydrogenase family)|nr:oxidoreductase [Pseudonocardiaceae bacterium]